MTKVESPRWKNAFKMPRRAALTAGDEKWLARAAEKIRKQSLSPAAVLFLESISPFHGLGSQAAAFFEPLLSAVLPAEEPGKITALLENPGAVSRFVEMLKRQ